ncbi:MAG: periplasmic heavy metal sensor [bacterium]|nr:periplasmic heavy metal sensor [bacterium]
MRLVRSTCTLTAVALSSLLAIAGPAQAQPDASPPATPAMAAPHPCLPPQGGGRHMRVKGFGGPFGDHMLLDGDPGMMLPAMLQGVGLTAEQQAQVRAILQRHHETLSELFAKLRTANQAVADTLIVPDTTPEAATQKLDDAIAVRAQLMREGLAIALEVRAILTPEQLAKGAAVKTRMRELREEMRQLVGDPVEIGLPPPPPPPQ